MLRSRSIHRTLLRAGALCACAMLASSCHQTRRLYQPPTSDAGARIRLLTDGVVHLVPAKPCVDFGAPRAGLGAVAADVAIFNKAMNGRTLGMPGAEAAARTGLTTTELLAEVDEPLLVSYVHTTTVSTWPTEKSWTCRAYFRFAPRDGIDYAAVARSVEGGRRCGIGVYAIGDKGGEYAKPVGLANEYRDDACK